jgi:RNA 3'-terminal phosphate cyclase
MALTFRSVERATSMDSALAVELVYERTRAAFDALGEPGKPAEEVAGSAGSMEASLWERR